MTRTKTILRALLGVGAAGAIAAFGTFSAFSSTTDNPGNTIATGTVVLGDNDNGVDKLIDISAAKPSQNYDRCFKVTYTGTLASDVKLTIPAAVGALGSDIDLEVAPGTQTGTPPFGDCTNFTPGADIYGDGPGGTNTLADFQTTHNLWSNGLLTNPSDGKWDQNDSTVYRFRVRVRDTAAQNASTNAFTVKFEAQNQ